MAGLEDPTAESCITSTRTTKAPEPLLKAKLAQSKELLETCLRRSSEERFASNDEGHIKLAKNEIKILWKKYQELADLLDNTLREAGVTHEREEHKENFQTLALETKQVLGRIRQRQAKEFGSSSSIRTCLGDNASSCSSRKSKIKALNTATSKLQLEEEMAELERLEEEIEAGRKLK